jgi:hypothetical protein
VAGDSGRVARAARRDVANRSAPCMMILRSSPPSPFGRKVRIAADVAGLAARLDIVLADTSSNISTIWRAAAC